MENKTCKQCQEQFEVADQDLVFYEKMGPEIAGQKYAFPAPTLCPKCRQIKRLSFINYKKLYRRKCDKSGEDIVSCFPPNSPYKIWKNENWWKDDWDPMSFGRDFDFNRPFFEQMHELDLAVPKPHTFVFMNENSEFTNGVTAAKNSYIVLNSTYTDNCFYGYRLTKCKDCIDCHSTYSSEKCYECTNVTGCFDDLYCRDCEQCSESILLEDCSNCKNCIACSNLKNKQYWINNRQSTKEEFDKQKAEFLSLSYSDRQEFIKHAKDAFIQTPKRFARNLKCENCTGDYLTNCKNAVNSYHASECQEITNCFDMYQAKDARDYDLWGAFSQNIYECAEVGEKSNNVAFCHHSYGNISNVYYSIGALHGTKNCFGCVYIQHKEYCILNKQYTKEQYEELLPRIIEHMKKTGEWGEFHPMSTAEFGYNETIAPDCYPMTKEEAQKFGANWQDEDFSAAYSGEYYEPKEISAYLPEKNPDYQAEIDRAVAGVLKCEQTGKVYRLQAKELAFYIENGLQIPRFHPDWRYELRLQNINPMNLWHRQCMCQGDCQAHQGQCPNEFETSYSPDRPERIYCERCYQQIVR